ncbi:Hypothetical protein A7982_01313 [Minicystis rosea]|nr:Hypothetical protein A7982_01313 [Minicystis rosea]
MNVTTITAADIEPAAEPLPTFDAEAELTSLLGAPIEARYRWQRPLVGRTDVHPLVQAAYMAYTERHPLAISPDVIWLCLARGFTHHVAHRDDLRRHFLRNEADFAIAADVPETTEESPWPLLFADFSRQIGAFVGDLRYLVTPDFSTTGPVERMASELATAGPFAPHFEWTPPFPGDRVFPRRGIPSVHLLGTADDWCKLRTRAQRFAPYGLEPWMDQLLPVLDEIIASAEGDHEEAFWRAFFRYENGADELTGWIHVLFPYLRAFPHDHFVPNPHLDRWLASYEAAETRRAPIEALGDPKGPGLAEMPPGLSSVSMRALGADGHEHAMDLVGGLIGVTQDPPSRVLFPEIAWAILRPDDAAT